jgi:soluble lytic murein transglycosylase
MTSLRSLLVTIPVAILMTAIFSALANSQDMDAQALLEEQRRVFREVYPQAELGNWRPAASNDALLQQYVLWPELRSAWLRTRVRNNDFTQVDVFLDQYGTLKPARELRYHYALSLGRSGSHTQYFDLYQQFFQGMDVSRLDCLALQAEIAAGRNKRIVNRGINMWLVGRNQVDECDPVFDHLRDRGILDTSKYEDRFELAIDARQFSLARYLARSLPADYQHNARQWTAVVNDSVTYLEGHDISKDSEQYRAQLLYAVQRIAYKQPAIATTLWRDVQDQYPFSIEQQNTIDRHVALWTARHGLANATGMLDALPANAVDKEVRRWRVRSYLREHDWSAVTKTIGGMPPEEQAEEVWRYWLARANLQLGNNATASSIFASLAVERSFYGFLAADHESLAYSFSNSPLIANDTTIDELQNKESLIRAHELFVVGLEGRGRSEWDAAVSMLSADQKLQASILAHQWGWHSRAISTAATVGQYDDLELRYPIPYRQEFEKHANGSNIQHSWALGIARSESLFMRDIRSSAGAIGLMQLMPDTARRTARDVNLKYAGLVTLTDPDSNIRLGTAYLRKMLERFDNHQVLATAAYNAGPLNVEKWLPEDGDVDALIWIENIPFTETRKYVKRVLATDTIFHWRLTGESKRLTPILANIHADRKPQQVASELATQ